MMKTKQMYIICVALLLIFSWNIGFAQEPDIGENIVDQNYPTEGFCSIRGQFLFRLENELIYVNKSSTNKKSMCYSIKAINMRTHKKTLIDWSSNSQCVKYNRNTMLYIKNGVIMSWNANSKDAKIYCKIRKAENLKGIGFNTDNLSLLLVLKGKKSKSWICRLIDRNKRIVMNDTLNIDTIPHENIQPKIGYVNNYFAISVKNNLFILNCNKLELKLQSNKCYEYLLNSYYVTYYQWRNSTELDSYYYSFKTGETLKINSVLNEDIVKCSDSFFFKLSYGNVYFLSALLAIVFLY